MKAKVHVVSVTVNSDGSIRYDSGFGGTFADIPDQFSQTTAGCIGPVPSGVTRMLVTAVGADIVVTAGQPFGSNSMPPARILVLDRQPVLFEVQTGDYINLGHTSDI